MAQDKTDDIKKQIYETKANISKDDSADELMKRMREKSEKKSFESMAAKEMADSFNGQDSLEKDFEKFENTVVSDQVKDKLEKMKQKLNTNP